MRRRRRRAAEEPGQDSFLDIVANLVGILIILVMIVGAQAKDAMLEASSVDSNVNQDEVSAQRAAMVAVRTDLESLVDKTRRQDLEIAYRRAERQRMLELVAATRQALEKKRQELSREQQDAHQLQREIAEARRIEQDLKMSREAVERTTAPVKVLKHHPTPLAKTVFGREVHFRLKDNRLAYVPLDELVEQFKNEAKQKVWKLTKSPAITETVGPIGDFRLKYTLTKKSYSLETRTGSAVQERVELDHFVLVPVRDDLGEPVEEALQPQSQFRSILSSYDPKEVTVTIWVYPESFDAFRTVQEELLQFGFLTASRPLPAGMPISGSPSGTRSAAQ